MARGVARGVFRLVALVRVGCMVGGRTAIDDTALLGGELAGGRMLAIVGWSVDEIISPEWPGDGSGIDGVTGEGGGGDCVC